MRDPQTLLRAFALRLQKSSSLTQFRNRFLCLPPVRITELQQRTSQDLQKCYFGVAIDAQGSDFPKAIVHVSLPSPKKHVYAHSHIPRSDQPAGNHMQHSASTNLLVPERSEPEGDGNVFLGPGKEIVPLGGGSPGTPTHGDRRG